MSEYTTSYVWKGVAKGERRGVLRHAMRDLDRRQGVPEMRHSNEQIDAARTLQNVTMIVDGKGGFERAKSVQQFLDLADEKVAASVPNTRRYKSGKVVEVAHREDAAFMVEHILQLDPVWTEGWRDWAPEKYDEMMRLLNVMIDKAVEHDGYDCTLGYSINLDETNPHVHLYSVPIDDQGRLNKRAKFAKGVPGYKSGREAYVERHDSMREALREHGYEATFERVGKGRKGEKLAQFKKEREREARNAAEEARLAALRAEMETVMEDARETNRAAIEAIKASKQREKDVVQREESVARRETDVRARERAAQEAEDDGYNRGFELGEAAAKRGLVQQKRELGEAIKLFEKEAGGKQSIYSAVVPGLRSQVTGEVSRDRTVSEVLETLKRDYGDGFVTNKAASQTPPPPPVGRSFDY